MTDVIEKSRLGDHRLEGVGGQRLAPGWDRAVDLVVGVARECAGVGDGDVMKEDWPPSVAVDPDREPVVVDFDNVSSRKIDRAIQ